jgi:hypothetical protein
MGYVKLLKAGGKFDLLPAEGIGQIAINPENNTINVQYVNGDKIVITCASSPVIKAGGGDDNKIFDAIEKINGASGEGIFPATLSTLITSTQVSAI